MHKSTYLLIALGLFALSGCGPRSQPVTAQATAEENEAFKDPLLKQINDLPLNQREAFVEAHRQEISTKNPAFQIMLDSLVPRQTEPRR